MLVVRPEVPTDYRAVARIHEVAFEEPVEARLVDALRREATPHVSLVAHDTSDTVVGHVLFSPVTLDPDAPDLLVMGLAPMAVLPAYQRQGVGTRLVHEGLQHCRALGAAAVVVLGHPDYYPRHGFAAAHTFGLRSEYDVPPEAFMALELTSGALGDVERLVRYHPVFADVG